MENPKDNADVVRRGYAAFNSGDMQTLTELFHEKAVWHTPGRSSVSGDHRGRDAIFALFGRYAGETEGNFKADLLNVLTSDDGRVVGIHHNSAQRKGKTLEVDCCITFEFKDGKVIDGREHFYDLYSWDEFWA